MSDVLKSNPTALRSCILFEVLQRTPIKEVYSKFCRTLGNDFMEYREFEFCYYRFLNGDYDSIFEIDKDRKVHELSDMPTDVMEKIVENLDIFDRLALSKTSRSFRTFIQDQKLFQRTLALDSDLHVIRIKFGGETEMQYKTKEENCIKRLVKPGKLIEKRAPREEALQDFNSILKNPKLHLNTLEINWCCDEEEGWHETLLCLPVQKLEDALKVSHQLNVRKLSIASNDLEPLLTILPLFKPGYLTDIHVDFRAPKGDVLEKIVELEQWKQAKTFYQDGCGFFNFSLRHFYHFDKFTVSLATFPLEEVQMMEEILFPSPNFKECTIFVVDSTGANAIKEEFGYYIRQEYGSPFYTETYFYPLVNFLEFIEIEVFESQEILIRKKRL